MEKTKIAAGVLAGIAIGAIAGVLFAPEKGSDTRKKISKKGSEAIDDLNDKVDDLLCTVADKFDDLKKQANNLYEKGKSRVA